MSYVKARGRHMGREERKRKKKRGGETDSSQWMWPFLIQYLQKHNNADKQNLSVGTNQKNLLLNYSELQYKWRLKCYLEVSIRAKRRRIHLERKISKLQGIRRGYEKGRCPLHLKEQDTKYCY